MLLVAFAGYHENQSIMNQDMQGYGLCVTGL